MGKRVFYIDWLCIVLVAGLFVIIEAKSGQVNIAYYEEIKDLPNHPEKLLIDVRREEEIEKTGRIPTSINILLTILEINLSNETSPQLFKTLYGRDKPEIYTPVIFSCRSGSRSLEAYKIAEALGYKNIKNYAGSWLDWAEREGLPKN